METTELTDENFWQVISTEQKAALVEFGAEWCPPCRAMNPVLEKLSDDYKETVVIGKVNVDDHPGITSHFGVRNLPTFLFFKEGKPVNRIVGAVSKLTLEREIDSLLKDGKL